MITINDVVGYMANVQTHTGISVVERRCVEKHFRALILQSLSEKQKQAYDLALEADNRGVTYLDVANSLQVSQSHACNILKSLHDLHLLVKGLDPGRVRSRWFILTF